MFIGYIGYKCSQSLNECLPEDVKTLSILYKDELVQKTSYGKKDVKLYYTKTTDRDYQILKLFSGPGLHTRLKAHYPIGHSGGTTRQPALILAELRSSNARRVLEIGCGRGHCSLWMAGAARDVEFVGIDLTPRHVAVARKEAHRSGLTNVEFLHSDATNMNLDQQKFDAIFGVEAFCHLDTPVKQRAFMASAWQLLNPGGIIVIFDGFRSPTFHECCHNQRLAMLFAEAGFKIRAMPTKQNWIDVGCESFDLEVVKNFDYTDEALPFWELGWRVARAILIFPPLVRFVIRRARQSASNLLSVATVAHALRDKGAAEYGMLVLRKKSTTWTRKQGLR